MLYAFIITVSLELSLKNASIYYRILYINAIIIFKLFFLVSIMDEKIFYVGQMFSSKEEVLCFFREFCRMHFQPLTIRNSSEEKIVFKCCHGRKRKSLCTGQRPHQHYLFKNCTAQVNVYKGKKNYWQVTNVDLQHNHEIGSDMCGRKRKFIQQDYKLISDLVEAKPKGSIITRDLKKKNSKIVTQKDIQNIKNKLFLLSSEEKEAELKSFLIKVLEENGQCSISYNSKNTVQTLFIATDVMINCFRKSQPPVIQIDVSFGFDSENYKLMGFCYYSSVTGKSEFAGLAFILKETLDIIRECLEEFKKICANDPFVFLIDKDFKEMSAIRDVFPSSVILLCKLHVLNYIKNLLSSAVACNSAKIENVFKTFKKSLYSQTEEEYEERKFDLLIIANEVQVCVGNKYVLFRDEFNKNWDSCKEMWVHCYRKNLPLMRDSTTKKIEKSFWILKNYINTNFHCAPTVCESIVGLVDFVTKRLSNSISYMMQKVFKIMDKNPKIRSFLDSASLRLNETGLKLLHESLVSLEGSRSAKAENEKGFPETCSLYSTNINSCKCEFWKSYEAPCQHILLLREVLNTELCIEDCFHKRYLVTEDNQDNLEFMERMSAEDTAPRSVNICKNNRNNDNVKTLSHIEKYRKVSAVTQELNKTVSALGTQKCLEYIEQLKNFVKLARQGESVAVNSTSNLQIKKKTELPESSVLDES